VEAVTSCTRRVVTRVADATFQSGPQAMMDATVFNVERFFGWVASTHYVCDALNTAGTSVR